MARVRNTLRSTSLATIVARRAFTMLEILIVIGVLAILASIVLLGMRHVTGKAKDQETRIALQNLRNMLGEFDSVTRLGKGPPVWGFIDDGGARRTVKLGDPPLYQVNGEDVFPDFWRAPYKSNREAPAVGTNSPAPMDAPGSFLQPDSTMRNGARQLMFTQLAMNYLLSVPANRSAVEKLRADKLFAPIWVSGSMPGPGQDGVLGTQDDQSEQVYFYRGCRVRHDNTYWRFKNNEGASSSPPTPGGDWDREGQEASGPKSLPAPILLDGWGNPILLVPATGLRVRMLNGEGKLDPMKRGQTVVVVSPDGSVKAANMATNEPGKLVRPGKPFFVSAGPDGDFSTGDDNLYSFEE